MKKETLKKRLTLDKLTISNLGKKLDDVQKNNVAGGVKSSIPETYFANCVTVFCDERIQ